MAATFSFSTTTILSGHAMEIYSTSTNWNEYVPASSTSALLTITALDGDLIFIGGTAAFTKTLSLTTDLVGDFAIDITVLEMFGTDKIIPDDILTVKIDIIGTVAYTYTSDEVFYYNAWLLKSNACFYAVDQICNINSTEIKYACMVNILYQGLLADIVSANTGGVYDKIDIFKRLAHIFKRPIL